MSLSPLKSDRKYNCVSSNALRYFFTKAHVPLIFDWSAQQPRHVHATSLNVEAYLRGQQNTTAHLDSTVKQPHSFLQYPANTFTQTLKLSKQSLVSSRKAKQHQARS